MPNKMLLRISFLGRLKESYIQWASKASWTDVFKQILTIICITGTIGFALKFTTYLEATNIKTASGEVTQIGYSSDGNYTIV